MRLNRTEDRNSEYRAGANSWTILEGTLQGRRAGQFVNNPYNYVFIIIFVKPMRLPNKIFYKVCKYTSVYYETSYSCTTSIQVYSVIKPLLYNTKKDTLINSKYDNKNSRTTQRSEK